LRSTAWDAPPLAAYTHAYSVHCLHQRTPATAPYLPSLLPLPFSRLVILWINCAISCARCADRFGHNACAPPFSLLSSCRLPPAPLLAQRIAAATRSPLPVAATRVRSTYRSRALLPTCYLYMRWLPVRGCSTALVRCLAARLASFLPPTLRISALYAVATAVALPDRAYYCLMDARHGLLASLLL